MDVATQAVPDYALSDMSVLYCVVVKKKLPCPPSGMGCFKYGYAAGTAAGGWIGNVYRGEGEGRGERRMSGLLTLTP